MSPRDWPYRAEDILEAIEETQSFIEGFSFEEFAKDKKTIKAVGANLLIIGEAANNIPEEIRARHSEVPWQVMRAIRNRLVHAYFDIDPHILWETCKDDLPKLVEPIRKLLNDKDRAAE